jgi:hypothetical protein
MNNYPGATERLNMLVRRMKNYRDQGSEVVFIAHEALEKIYAKGGAMASKGQPPTEPIAVKGLPDMPGKQAPEEFCRAADNIFRVRHVNGKPAWIARREPIGGGGEVWEVKDRFNAGAILSGMLPASYSEVAALAQSNPLCNWDPPYIWIFYGTFGIGKTRSLKTFPTPMVIFDLDRGTSVLKKDFDEMTKAGHKIEIYDDIDVEESDHYNTFLGRIGSL